MSGEISGVLETSHYTGDLEAAERFYRDVLGLRVHASEPDRHVFFSCGRGMLLLFNTAHTSGRPTTVGGQPIPLHGASGPGHVCFAIRPDEVASWRDRLESHGVTVESEVEWPGGGASIYFRDPAGNSLELATPAVWAGAGLHDD